MIKRFRNKKSFLLLIISAFWLTYLVVTVLTFTHEAEEHYNEYLAERKQILRFHFSNAENYLLNNKPQALLERLILAQEIQQFDFFILKEGGRVIGSSLDEVPRDIDPRYLKLQEIVESDTLIVGNYKLLNHELLLGVSKSHWLFLKRQFQNRVVTIIKDIFTMTLLLALIVYMVMKDILQLSKLLSSHRRLDASRVVANSFESQAILRASQSLEANSKTLSTQNQTYSLAIASAILTEIKSEKPPPYSISCTMARIDMNDYTRFLLDSKPAELQAVMSEFFRLCREIIERYGGGIYQYVGDEVIFLLKDKDPKQSARLVTRIIADIFASSHRVKCKTFPNGACFKASLVSGSVFFVQPDLFFAFSGNSLAETGRMLSQVEEKHRNTLVMYAHETGYVSDLCKITNPLKRRFKGFKQEAEICEVHEFSNVVEFTKLLPQQGTDFQLHQIPYLFRSNSALKFTLNLLSQTLARNDELTFLDLAAGLRQYEINTLDPEILAQINELLDLAFKKELHLKNESRTLSTLVALLTKICGKGIYHFGLAEKLELLTQAKDPRTVANSIRALEHMGLPLLNQNIFLNSENNRVKADAIILAGKKEFNKSLFKMILKSLESKNPRHIASALYAATSLILHYQERDPVYLSTNLYFERLLQLISPFASHEDILVRTRAQISINELQTANINLTNFAA